MKKLKIFAKIISIIFLAFSFVSVTILGLIAGNVKSDLLNHNLPKNKYIVDSIGVHFIHGSIPHDSCTYKKIRLGGYLGGHIEIEVENNVYGFLHDTLPINYIPKRNFNSKFEVRNLDDWKEHSRFDRITSIYIPVTNTQRATLIALLNNYLQNEPYDYAFLGQRCTSSTAEILSDVGILNKFSNFEAIISFYYPRTLRFTMIQFARKNELEVKYKEGINCHSWE